MQATRTRQSPTEQKSTDQPSDPLSAAVDKFLYAMQGQHLGIDLTQHIKTLRLARNRSYASPGTAAFAIRIERNGGRPTLISLPFELLAQICDHLRQRALYALSLTCRYTYHVARDALYKRPHLGDLLKGDSFRFACTNPPADRLGQITSLVCNQWNLWQPWFTRVGCLPNLSHIHLRNDNTSQDRGISLLQALTFLARQPRLRSATLYLPSDDLCGFNPPNTDSQCLALTWLRLLGISPSDDFGDPLCEGLSRLCPNIAHIMLSLPRDDGDDDEDAHDSDDDDSDDEFGDYSRFGASDLDFLSDFAELRTYNVDGPLDFDGGGQLPAITRRVQSVSLNFLEPIKAARIFEYIPRCPVDLFIGIHARLEYLYWAGTSWLHATRVASSLADFPNLKRLKLIHFDQAMYLKSADEDDDDDTDHSQSALREEHARTLQAHGFSVHSCYRCLYAARGYPGRLSKKAARKGHTSALAWTGEVSCPCT